MDFEKENNNLNENNIHLKSKEQEQSVIQVPHEGLYNQSIPFVSQISGVIYTKKKECTRLQNEKINLESKLKELHKKIKTANDHLANISKKEGVIQYYLDWFYRLKKELWDVYCIRIEDISNFVNVISEFEHHHYDAYQIISEYSRFLSVRHEIIIKETQIATLEQKERSLYGKIVSLESRLSFVNHRMEIYEELEAIGFGIKELGQLYSLFVEMSDANNIPLKQAWSKFFKDIKEQYYCKLGFELAIEEYKEKLEKNKNEFPNSVYDLQIKSLLVQYYSGFFKQA